MTKELNTTEIQFEMLKKEFNTSKILNDRIMSKKKINHQNKTTNHR